MIQILKLYWHIIIPVCILLVSVICSRQGRWKKHVASAALLNAAILCLVAVFIAAKTTTLPSVSPILSSELLDSLQWSDPKQKTLYDTDFMLDISESVDTVTLRQRIYAIKSGLDLKNVRFFVFGRCLLMADNIDSIYKMKQHLCEDGNPIHNKTDIGKAILSYFKVDDNKQARNLVIITDDENKPVSPIADTLVASALRQNSFVRVHLIRLPSRSRKYYLSEHFRQFVTIDTISTENSLFELKRELSMQMLLQDMNEYRDSAGNNLRLSFASTYYTNAGILNVSVASGYNVWPVLIHITDITIDGYRTRTNMYRWINTHDSIRFNIPIDDLKTDLGFGHSVNEAKMSIEYRIYFAGSSRYSFDVAQLPGDIDTTGPLRQTVFQDQLQNTVVLISSALTPKGLLMIVALWFVIGRILRFSYKARFRNTTVVITHVFYGRSISRNIRDEARIDLPDLTGNVLATLQPYARHSLFNIFRQPNDGCIVTVGNSRKKFKRDFALMVSQDYEVKLHHGKRRH